MARWQRLWAVGLAVVLALLAGCGSRTAPGASGPAAGGSPAAQGEAAQGSGGAQGQVSSQAQAGAQGQGASGQAVARKTQYPLTVTDGAGRTVVIEKEPQRILSLAPSNTEILWALGAGSRQVGRTDYCDYPAEAKQVPSVGGIVNPNVEKMAELKPDLVLMTGGSVPLRERLAGELKMTVYVVDPQNLDQVYEGIRQLGVILNVQDRAEALVAQMQQKVAAVTAKVAGIPQDKRPKVFYEVWPDPLMTAGPGTFIDDLIRLAGGVNVGADAKERWAQYSLEQLVQHDPDLIITPNQKSAEELKARARKGWENLKAVREGKVLLVPDQNVVSRPGPRLVEGLEMMARLIHPEVFGP